MDMSEDGLARDGIARAVRDVAMLRIIRDSTPGEWNEQTGTPVLVELFVPSGIKKLLDDLGKISSNITGLETALFTDLIINGIKQIAKEMQCELSDINDNVLKSLEKLKVKSENKAAL